MFFARRQKRKRSLLTEDLNNNESSPAYKDDGGIHDAAHKGFHDQSAELSTGREAHELAPASKQIRELSAEGRETHELPT